MSPHPSSHQCPFGHAVERGAWNNASVARAYRVFSKLQNSNERFQVKVRRFGKEGIKKATQAIWVEISDNLVQSGLN